MKFKTFFCDPLEADIIELGDMENETIISYFEKIDWKDFLQKSSNAKLDEIYYHPTFEIENKESKIGLGISAVGDPNNYVFNITFKRPKKVKSFLGLNDKINENYSTGIAGQSKNDALNCLNALLRNDTQYLANKFGQ